MFIAERASPTSATSMTRSCSTKSMRAISRTATCSGKAMWKYRGRRAGRTDRKTSAENTGIEIIEECSRHRSRRERGSLNEERWTQTSQRGPYYVERSGQPTLLGPLFLRFPQSPSAITSLAEGKPRKKTFFLNIITTTTAYIIHCIGNKPSPNTESNELGSLIHEHQNSFHELPRLCL